MTSSCGSGGGGAVPDNGTMVCDGGGVGRRERYGRSASQACWSIDYLGAVLEAHYYIQPMHVRHVNIES